ncbi:MAG: hypothetical protein ACI8TQ_003107 [Planctomycetota bacterium]|jgi:hypothetical protein
MLFALIALTIASDPYAIESERYRLHSDVEPREALTEVLVDLDELWIQATLFFGDMPKRDRPLNVFLYDTIEKYREVDQRLTKGHFASNLAFSHWGSWTSHVALQPPTERAVIEHTGVPKQSRSLVVHEASHTFMYALFPNHISHPNWFSEGCANWLSAKVGVARGWGGTHKSDPYSSEQARITVELLAEGTLPTVAAILDESLELLTTGQRYAVHDVFFRYLMSEKSKPGILKLFDGIRREDEGPKFTARTRAIFESQFGPAKSNEKSFGRYVEKLAFAWDQTYRSLEATGDEWVQIAYPDKNAIAWRTASAGTSHYEIAGSLTVLSRKGRQMNLLLDRRKDGEFRGFVSLAFSVGNGLTLFEYLPDGAGWENRGSVKLEDLKLDEALTFEVLVRDDHLEVKVGGELVLEENFNGRKLEGPWGIGTQTNTAGIWKIEKAPGL